MAPDNGNYWVKQVTLPVVDGKFDSSKNPFANGQADMNTVVDDPYGTGTTAKYRVNTSNDQNPYGDRVYKALNIGQAWEMPEEQSGQAWTPVLSATAKLTKFGTGFVRFAQTTRFPNIYELTSSSIVGGDAMEGTLALNGASKPERSTNWEVGYAHNMTQFLPGLGFADARISYYHTVIQDFIDRTLNLDTIQFDRKKTSGLEFQSRFDTGHVFGSLGGTYRLKQELCDKDYASSMDPFYNRIPTCMTGGFPGTYSGSSLLPKYSLNMLLGARSLNDRLEYGWRGTYHAGAKNKQLDSLLGDSTVSANNNTTSDMWFRGGQDMFYWKPVVLHDLYVQFRMDKNISFSLNIVNVTDQYYLDPMAKTVMPGPGRTFTAGMTINF